MNISMVIYTLGWVIKVEGACLLLPCIIAGIYQEREGVVYLICAHLFLLIGFLMTYKRPEHDEIYTKEGMVTVAGSWIVLSLFGAIPFVATGEFSHYIDALFEIASGFTTTGASIRRNVENLCHCTLFWRSFSHWIGGMGVLIFVLMLIPGRSGSLMHLMRAESPGYDVTKIVPRIRETAKILYKIYMTLTLVEMLLLIVFRMPWFDAVCLTFGTAGTGGFGVLNSSCAAYSTTQQIIITVFMALFGINFAFFYLIRTKKVGAALKMEEVRFYVGILIFAALLIGIDTAYLYRTAQETLLNSFFTAVSIMTTTGFSVCDFNMWPVLSKYVLILLMCIGACAGSTGGGMKVSRFIVYFKENRRTLRSYLHQRGKYKIRIDGKALEESTVHTINRFLLLYVAVFAVSVFVLSFDRFNFETNFSAVAATLNNIGPGLAAVGPTSNYGGFTVVSKLTLIFDMIAGRLELFPMLLLFYPGTWKKSV